MGLWDSVIITVGFSIIVIVADEIIHARRRKARGETGKH